MLIFVFFRVNLCKIIFFPAHFDDPEALQPLALLLWPLEAARLMAIDTIDLKIVLNQSGGTLAPPETCEKLFLITFSWAAHPKRMSLSQWVQFVIVL